MTSVLIAIALVAPIAFSIGVARGVSLAAESFAAKLQGKSSCEPRLDIGPALRRALRSQS